MLKEGSKWQSVTKVTFRRPVLTILFKSKLWNSKNRSIWNFFEQMYYQAYITPSFSKFEKIESRLSQTLSRKTKIIIGKDRTRADSAPVWHLTLKLTLLIIRYDSLLIWSISHRNQLSKMIFLLSRNFYLKNGC